MQIELIKMLLGWQSKLGRSAMKKLMPTVVDLNGFCNSLSVSFSASDKAAIIIRAYAWVN